MKFNKMLSVKTMLLGVLLLLLTCVSTIAQPESMNEFSTDNNLLRFSGYDWFIKESDELRGPGPNYFLNSTKNIYIDVLDNLHLKIVNEEGVWKCSEVISKNQFGYGRYVFNVKSRVDMLDANAVLGIFLWDPNALKDYNHEVDIELSKWSSTNNMNAQFVVQPNTIPENIKRFNMNLMGNYCSFTIDWFPDRIIFNAYHGHIECDPKKNSKPKNVPIQSWVFKDKGIPVPRQSNIRFNLWLNQGMSPLYNQEQEVIITCFSFTPLTH